MRRAALLFAAAAPLAIVWSCGPIADVPVEEAAKNTCRVDSGDCDKLGKNLVCDPPLGCTVDGTATYLLAVTVPGSSRFASNTTFIFPPGTQSDNTIRTGEFAGALRLPQLQEINGSVVVQKALVTQLGRPLGVNGDVTLPVRAVLRPLYPFDGSGTPVDARSLGLPLDVVVSEPVLYENQQPPGPGNSAQSQFRFLVPPMRFELVATPQGGLATTYPPVVQSSAVVETDVRGTGSVRFPTVLGPADLSPSSDRTATFASETRDLAGWTGYLQISSTKAVYSSVVALAGKSTTAVLHTVKVDGYSPLLDVVIAPPPGSIALPVLEAPFLGPANLKQTYPELEVPLPATGVVSNAGFAVPSRIDFISRDISTTSLGDVTYLHYRVSVTTDDYGRFATVLPQGHYRVIISPFGDTSFARTEAELTLDNANPVSFTVRERTRVQGCAVLPDGRGLADAAVRLVPAATLRRDGEPEAAWPRPSYVRANRLGVFVLEADPGDYDLVVEPTPESGFPWVVQRFRACGGADGGVVCPRSLDYPPVLVPAPIAATFRVVSPGSTPRPVEQAYLRAFAPTPEGVFVEIAAARTDARGAAALLLAPRDQKVGPLTCAR